MGLHNVTSRRSMQTNAQRMSRALQFLPGHVGGRVASAQPVQRRATVGQVEQVEIVYPASNWGYDSGLPPYAQWIMDWNNNLPTDLVGTGFLRFTLSVVDVADTSFAVVYGSFNGGTAAYVTVTGGPFTVGQVIQTPTFSVNMGGFDSSEANILYPGQVLYYAGVPRTTGYIAATDAVLVMV